VNKGKIGFGCFLTMLVLAMGTAGAQPAEHGKADISGHDFEEKGLVYLWGTWEFYWNRLLTPEDFKIPQHPEWIMVPGSWHRQGNYTLLGFSTYRLLVELPEKQNGLSIYFPIVKAAAKIWINGELMEEIGKVSPVPVEYRAKLGGAVLSIPETERRLEIVVQVANYTYFSGGLPRSPIIDRTSNIFSRMGREHGIENFFAGSLVAMFIYQIILYFLYQRGKPYLWLALICLGVALRSLIVHGGSFLLPNLYPEIPWEYWKKIEFGSIYGIIALFPLYVYHLFIAQAPKKPVYFFTGTAVLMVVAVLVTPQHVYGQLLDVCHIMLLLGFIYAVYAISRAWRSGNEDARIILFGVLASFPFILGEILQNTALVSVNINFRYLVELGVLVFLLFQVYLLANHYAKSYRKLEQMNQTLEKMVEERTAELSTANTVKDRLLSVVSHDIKSPLNSLRGILQIYNRGAISKDEFNHFTQHIETDLNKTTILVENILYWTASQLKGVKVSKEKFDLYKLLEENVELFHTVALNKKISVTHNTPEGLVIRTDRNILNLVLRNLIANAIKFSFEGGEVTVSVRKADDSLMVRVSDKGVGMDGEALRNLLEPEQGISTSGTKNESGTGMGLALCREYLRKAGGRLDIESTKGKGSAFNVVMPLD
jgi:two-component system sensor histidine kinase ChiS